MTLLALSFHATRMNVVRSRWQSEKREKKYPDTEEDTKGTRGTESYVGGTFIVFDWEKNCIIWQIEIDAVSGFCWQKGQLFLNRLRAGEIVVLDRHGREVQRISHRALNDLHTIFPTGRGFLLTSSGTDSILEIDQQGNLLYEWCALDYGYHTLYNSKPPLERLLDRALDQRYMIYPTSVHTTHVNSARLHRDDEDSILATLFHQGEVIEIDRRSRQVRTVVSGLHHPHDIRPYGKEGWLLCDSGHNQVLILDRDWQIRRCISLDFDWVQSSASLTDGSIVIADTNHHRLVRFNTDDASYEVRSFPTEWRIFQVEEVPDDYVEFFQNPSVLPFL